uniref:Uncharacterized protein n=1 Tax=Anguilla anguilla TaxID=7936 RepID=A0A0E9PCB1_ANGAN
MLSRRWDLISSK